MLVTKAAPREIVGPRGLRGDGLLDVVRRDADDLIRPEQCAGAGTGEVALPDVDAVGPHLDRNLHVVVDDAHDAAAAAEGDKAARFVEEILPAHMLFAQLDEGGTAVDGGPDAAEEVLRIRATTRGRSRHRAAAAQV